MAGDWNNGGEEASDRPEAARTMASEENNAKAKRRVRTTYVASMTASRFAPLLPGGTRQPRKADYVFWSWGPTPGRSAAGTGAWGAPPRAPEPARDAGSEASRAAEA